ncbi:MAG: PQQ-dependent sugar dehydrogenase [Planctomycetota bacterium]
MKDAALRCLPGAALASVVLAASIHADGPELATEIVASGLTSPTFVASPPGDGTRLVVAQQDGLCLLLKDGVLQPAPFLDLRALVPDEVNIGLLGLAFHPDYDENGYVYVQHPRGDPTSDRITVARYTVGADPDAADPISRDEILVMPYPAYPGHHAGGWIGFGPDGYLYLTVGDGVTTGLEEIGGAEAQSLDSLFGKVLRIDVDGDDFPGDPDRDYAVPADNPFVGAGEGAVWAYGLRNPYRASFDRATGELYVGDVGWFGREEIDLLPPGAGGLNFGWGCAEGTLCSTTVHCDCDVDALTDPIYEYDHTVGCSVTGGTVYRGAAIPGLAGTYFYGDYCTAKIWSFRYENGAVAAWQDRTAELDPPGAASFGPILSVTEGPGGELYITDTSRVYRVVSPVWGDLEGALAGTLGEPVLSGQGGFEAGTDVTLCVANARAGAAGWLLVGFQTSYAPLFGGVLVPSLLPPGFSVPLATDAAGEASVALAVAAGIPAGFEIFFQSWVLDPQGPFGFAATNGVVATTP